MRFTFTITRNGAIMVFTAVLILFAFYKAMNYFEFSFFVGIAIFVGFALSELAWHLPSEDLPNQERIPPDYRAVARTSIKVIVGIILIIAGLFVIFLVLGFTVILIMLTLTTSASTLGGFVFSLVVFFACASSGLFSIWYGGRMLLRLFKDDELEEAVKE